MRMPTFQFKKNCIALLLMLISLTMVSCVNMKPVNEGVDGDYSHKETDLRQSSKVLISNNVRDVAADENNVWISTDRGVSRFSRKDNRWEQSQGLLTTYTKEDGLVSDNVYVVLLDGEEVWFGTDNGISRYKIAENKWITYREEDGLISNKINCIAIDSNYIWIGTDRGLSRFDENINSWASRMQKDGLTTDIITSIAVDKDCVWIGTKAKRERHMDDWNWTESKRRSGVNRYDKNTDSWNTYTPEEGLVSGQVSTIAVDEDTVWIGTLDGGISCYSKKDQTFVKSYSKGKILDTDNIKSILVDGNYTWIGTANGGVYRYIKMTDTWIHFKSDVDNLADDHITSIAVSGNEVWLGTYEKGLSRYNKLTQKWITFVKAIYLADNDVRSITISDDEVWAATTRGLSRYDTKTNQWTTYGVKDGLISEYVTLVETFEDDVFTAVGNSLARLDGETERWSFYTDFGNSSTFVTGLEVQDDFLLIGTATAGIWKAKVERMRAQISPQASAQWKVKDFVAVDQLRDFTVERNAGSFGSKLVACPTVTSIEVDGTKVWVGTQGGLFVFDMEGNLDRSYTEKDGLASNHVNVMLHDGNITWIGTLGGVSRLVLERSEGSDKENSIWETFTSRDGLPSDNVRALALGAGELWIGTPKGLAVLRENETKYEIRTASFSESGNSFYDNIRSIDIRGDTLWLATAAGVLQLDPTTSEWKKYQAEHRRTPFTESEANNIEFDGTDVWLSNWSLSSSGCIARFDRISKSWIRYMLRDILHKPDAQGQSAGTTITNVKKIIPEPHYVWFTTDWGILRYDKELDTWRHYTTADGLVDNNIKCIVLGEDTVWVSSSGRKINKYDEKSDRWITMRFQNPRNRDENPIERNDEWQLEDFERREREERWDNIRAFVIADGSIWFRMGEGIAFFNEYTKELRRFTVEDGLASDRVRCLEYDGRYIWVGHESDEHSGTRGGVSRYDTSTSEWATYSSQSVLADDRVKRILVSKEHVWFLPDQWSREGATGYDKKGDNWFILNVEDGSEGEGNSNRFDGGIIEVANDEENIWVGSIGSGLLKFHPASDSWLFLSDSENMLNNVVLRDGLKVDENYVWVGTMGGLRLYDKKLETWTTYTKPTSLTGDEVRTVAVDKRYVWCGTGQGISRYDKLEGTWTHFRSKGGRMEIQIGNNTWSWHQEESREGLMDNHITGLAVDERYLWVTTSRGANRYDKIADIWDRYSRRNGLPSSSLTSVATDGSDVWVGTAKGLCRYPRMSDDPNAWGTYTSTIEIKPMIFSQEYAISLVSNKIRAIAADKDYIWVGTEKGVSKYDKKQDTWQTLRLKSEADEDGLVDDRISCIALDEDNVWFGTAHGVSKLSKKTLDWTTFTTENGLPSNQITCIAIDRNSVWLGTFDAGLVRYEGERDRWAQFTEEDGLAHNSVFSMTVDGDFIWIGTRRGLSRYDKRTKAWTTYEEY